MTNPLLLVILDGFGHRNSKRYNPVLTTDTPTLDHLFKYYPHTLLQASGTAVGLPAGQIGNSEVGHLHIGAGRKVPQDLTRIDQSVKNGQFQQHPLLQRAIDYAKRHDKAIHVLGLLSEGGVHSHLRHIEPAIRLLARSGVKRHYLHAILDGRDVAPQSAQASIEHIERLYRELPSGRIASVIGRYYAMDRDQRWQRTQKAYDLYTKSRAELKATSAMDALAQAYARGETDEFVSATCIMSDDKTVQIEDGDVVLFMNFRADRARQLCYAFTKANFTQFNRERVVRLNQLITLTHYADDLSVSVLYPPSRLPNTLGEVISSQGLTQLHAAETEKYAHVTYFINGGREAAFKGEGRLLVPSPKVATYDLQPQMSAPELTEKLCLAIKSKQHNFMVVNYANPDMIGHTGNPQAAAISITTVDQCLARLLDALKAVNGEAIITADHGNIELIFDEKIGQPHTAHTVSPVPLIYAGDRDQRLLSGGALDDIAPTCLALLGIKKPDEMSGSNLLRRG